MIGKGKPFSVESVDALLSYMEVDCDAGDLKEIELAIKNEKLKINPNDDSIVVELRNQVQYFSHDAQPGKVITFPRPKASVLIHYMDTQKKGDGVAMAEALARSTGITTKSIEDMDIKDFMLLSKLLTIFL